MPVFLDHQWQLAASLPLMKSILTSLAKRGLMLFQLAAAMSAADAAIQKKIYGSDHRLDLALHTTAMIFKVRKWNI